MTCTVLQSFITVLSQIDIQVDELSMIMEVNEENRRILLGYTNQIREHLLDDLERERIIRDLSSAYNQVLEYSTISDQILTRSIVLLKKYGQELYNTHFDFGDISSFKENVIVDTESVLNSLKMKVQDIDIKQMLILIRNRKIQVSLWNAICRLSDMSLQIIKQSKEQQEGNDSFLYTELERIKQQNERLQANWIKEREKNDSLNRELSNILSRASEKSKKNQMVLAELSYIVQELHNPYREHIMEKLDMLML